MPSNDGASDRTSRDPSMTVSSCPFISGHTPASTTTDRSSHAMPPTSSGSGLWEARRPVLDHCPKVSRRRLRQMGVRWPMDEVAKHRYPDDAWIAVDGKVRMRSGSQHESLT